jgi:hypothetical protein
MNLHDEGLDQWTDRRLFGHSPAGIVKLLDLYGSIPRSLLLRSLVIVGSREIMLT